jgi:hypothetical protein
MLCVDISAATTLSLRSDRRFGKLPGLWLVRKNTPFLLHLANKYILSQELQCSCKNTETTSHEDCPHAVFAVAGDASHQTFERIEWFNGVDIDEHASIHPDDNGYQNTLYDKDDKDDADGDYAAMQQVYAQEVLDAISEDVLHMAKWISAAVLALAALWVAETCGETCEAIILFCIAEDMGLTAVFSV